MSVWWFLSRRQSRQSSNLLARLQRHSRARFAMSEPSQKPSDSDWFAWSLAFLAIAGLVLVGGPNFIRARSTSACNACVNNLRQLDAAANQLALERSLTTGTRINFPNDLTPYIKLNSTGKIPSCPNGGIYSLKKIGDTPTCSLGSSVIPSHVLP